MRRPSKRPNSFSTAAILLRSGRARDWSCASTPPLPRSGLVHSNVLVADLDCRPAFNVADHPSRFEHNPRVGMRRAGQAALRYLHAADEHENVTVLIPVNLANRCFVTHGSTCRLRWTGYKSGGTAAEKVLPNSALMLLPQAFHIAR